MIELPLFPLHAVLVPGIVMPLTIFEPRYRAMIERCVERDEPFGVVWIRDGREVGPGTMSLATIGTMAEIRQVERTADGRYILLAAGTRRFSIDDVVADEEPYLVGRVTPLEEPVGDLDRASRLRWVALTRFARYLRLLEPTDGETAEPIDVRIEVDDPSIVASVAEEAGLEADAEIEVEPGGGIEIPRDPVIVSHLLSGIVQVEPLRRQLLLEAETAEARLAELTALLVRELELLQGRLRVFSPSRQPEPARLN
jgi:Lon protease-like protein